MAFDLIVDGVAWLNRLDLGYAKRKVSRDPLSGRVGGGNTVFFTSYAPILTSGSLVVYTTSSGSPVSGSADYDTGEVILDVVPTVQPTATYTVIPHTLSQQLSFLIGGFQIMESVWSRSWKLVDANGAAADEESASVLIVNSSGADPTCGAVAFSASGTQIGFYMACVRYAYLLASLTGAALTDYMWRETLRGMTVDRSRRPQNLEIALRYAKEIMDRSLEQALETYYTNGQHYGGFIGNQVTLTYAEVFEWQTAARNEGNRTLRGQTRLLPLTV